MKERIIEELNRRIEADRKNGLKMMGRIDLYMKKFVFDEDEGIGLMFGDVLSFSFPNAYEPNKKYGIIAMFAEDSFKFETIEQVADFLIETYCR